MVRTVPKGKETEWGMSAFDWLLLIVAGLYLWRGQYLSELVFYVVGGLLLMVIIMKVCLKD